VLDDYDGGFATRVSQHHDWHGGRGVDQLPYRRVMRVATNANMAMFSLRRWSDMQQERGPRHGIVNAAMIARMLP
jgi:hypothetical protein